MVKVGEGVREGAFAVFDPNGDRWQDACSTSNPGWPFHRLVLAGKMTCAARIGQQVWTTEVPGSGPVTDRQPLFSIRSTLSSDPR